eukprot:CAMPEP_0182422712 /NCGR_PEP_ID=MMETSP1167-20130531/8466_1 /TAXON_ID=2988 /ORGANISM="Mallomonas Sp, Strain CCMP3275" /LENGTH=355 /DNA_ID=CAMNT_0024601001 /DNA_START=54 /DNA_END=1119 /DNA_ORIENTATION=+
MVLRSESSSIQPFQERLHSIKSQFNSKPCSTAKLSFSEIKDITVKAAVLWGTGSYLFNQETKATVSEVVPSERVCSDSVQLFEGPKLKPGLVVLIGTAHISEDSAKMVKRAILEQKPDVVMIELDPKRIGRLPNGKSLEDAGFDIREDSTFLQDVASTSKSKPNAFNMLLTTARGWAQAAAGAVLGKALSSFYKSIEKLGFTPGAEFAAAVEVGRQIGARILLGDRDVDITLQHVSQAILDTDPESFERLGNIIETMMKEEGTGTGTGTDFSGGIPSDKESLSNLVEGLKQRKYLTSVMTTVKREVPLVYEALIGERDVYMADSIAGAKGSRVVAVVGMAHMDGIEKSLLQKGYQ